MKFKKIVFVLLVGLMFASCEKDDPIVPHQEELITTLTYTLNPVNGGDAVVLIYKDLDAEGLLHDAEITNGTLTANTTYNGIITLTNESETPTEDITPEVEEESDDHQFFFIETPNELTVTYNDKDGNSNPVGLKTTVVTGVDYAGGNLTIILKHEPNKTAEGVAGGNATNAGGDTDIEVTFELN